MELSALSLRLRALSVLRGLLPIRWCAPTATR